MKTTKENKQTTVTQNHAKIRALCEGAIMVAFAQILGYIKLFGNMPNGGSILSMISSLGSR